MTSISGIKTKKKKKPIYKHYNIRITTPVGCSAVLRTERMCSDTADLRTYRRS